MIFKDILFILSINLIWLIFYFLGIFIGLYIFDFINSFFDNVNKKAE